jgi:hypothetical protein
VLGTCLKERSAIIHELIAELNAAILILSNQML